MGKAHTFVFTCKHALAEEGRDQGTAFEVLQIGHVFLYLPLGPEVPEYRVSAHDVQLREICTREFSGLLTLHSQVLNSCSANARWDPRELV